MADLLPRGAGIGVPSVTVVLPDGERACHYRSRDIADRPDDDDLLTRLATRPPLDPPPRGPEADPEEHPDAMRTGGWGMYMRGVRSATAALAGRLEGAAREEAAATARMAESFIAAWRQRREEAGDQLTWRPDLAQLAPKLAR